MRDNSKPPAPRTIVVPTPVLILIAVAFLFVFMVIPGCCIGLGVNSFLDSNTSSSWPTAEGKIISARVESYEVDMVTGRPPVRTRRTVHRPVVIYEFAVAGRTYSSQELSFGDYGSTDPAHARSIVEKYPAGSSVTVYYSPSSPEKSVLEPGVTGFNFFYVLLGVPCFLFGAMLAVAFLYLWRRARQRMHLIYEAVLQVKLRGAKADDEYYLFVDGKDPAPKMLQRFQKQWPGLLPGSRVPRGKANCFSLDRFKWLTQTSAELHCGLDHGVDDRGKLYRVVARGDSWVVEDTGPDSES